MDVLKYKLSIVGDLGCGKSSLLTQYTQNYFLLESDPELIDTYSKEIILPETSRRVNVEIIDTIDFDAFHDDNTVSEIENSDGFLVAFDITSKNSYDVVLSNFHLIEKLISKNSRSPPPSVMLAGLKCDLESERQVSSAQALEAVAEFNLQGYFECSSKSSYNVEQLFTAMIEDIQASAADRRKKSIISLHSDQHTTGNNSKSVKDAPLQRSIHEDHVDVTAEQEQEQDQEQEQEQEQVQEQVQVQVQGQSAEETPIPKIRQTSSSAKATINTKESSCCVIV